MSKTTPLRLLPPVRRLLAGLGEHVKLARLRRNLSQQRICERAGISRPTLRELERGSPGVSLGTLVAVLQVFALEKDITLIARDDELGRRLQDAKLNFPKRRASRRTTPRDQKTENESKL
ncbi:MAG: helix-turn-helix domain-containing protein [Gammaproteobacteria bacterium]|nr:helix-turn-helix domain-containing protein [Gammaproteobacteria bacterium]